MNTNRLSAANIGVVGIVLAVTVSLASLQFDRLPFVKSGAEYIAYFADAGGLVDGDQVQVAGVKSGRVDEVSLDGAKVRVRFTLDESIPLGTKTTAAIKTNTVLGRKSMEVTPVGTGTLTKNDPIPLDRTTSPYSLNDALGDLSTTVKDLDMDQVNKTLDTLSATFADTPAPLRSALDGITALSRSINTRDQALTDLLGHAQGVTKVLSDRAQKINSLLVDGNSLFGELEARRNALGQLVVYVNGLAKQLTGFVTDNEAELGPTLDKLNSVLGILTKNEQDLKDALDAVGPYAGALGEQVGSGPYFQSYISNFSSSSLEVLVDAMVWPQNVPDALKNMLSTLGVGPGKVGPDK